MPAYCGKCGRQLEVVEGRALDPGHYCQKLLPGAKQVIIVMRQTGDFDVCIDGLFADRLTWGEMVEQVIGLTHPVLRKAHYTMRTPQQLAENDKKYGDNVSVIDGEYPEVEAPPEPVAQPAPLGENFLKDEDIPF